MQKVGLHGFYTLSGKAPSVHPLYHQKRRGNRAFR